eukprot:7717747-Pyramimonas_sp.AAC.1
MEMRRRDIIRGHPRALSNMCIHGRRKARRASTFSSPCKERGDPAGKPAMSGLDTYSANVA